MGLKASFRLLCVLAATGAGATRTGGAEEIKEVRLYTLDCGRAELKSMAMFSDTGEYDGKTGTIAVSCFVIRHPKGTLLWDTGLGDQLADKKDGIDNGAIHMTVPVKLIEQLKTLGLTPKDMTYLAFSHFHFDHTGNANLFPDSTWLLNKAELNWATGTAPPSGVNSESFSGYKTAKTSLVDTDYDIFGDGTVRILKTPGHTPGHQCLQLRLKKSGTVILSGDLYHLRENYEHRRVPDFNYNRADTLASMDRIEKIIQSTKARLIVQHDLGDFNAAPKFPAYLD
jgi:glyoxylase-like metal-dependent hydrolase (beta-lactamase superfamily II)